MSKIAFCSRFLLVALLTLHFIVEYNYDEEVFFFVVIANSILIITSSVVFLRKKKYSIKLGEKENLHRSPLIVLLAFAAYFVFLLYFVPKFVELYPDFGIERKSGYIIAMVFLIPQIIQYFMAFIFSDAREVFYATEFGLLKSLNADESFKWEDFYNFKIVDSHNIIRFQKKNLKNIYIKYDGEYFDQNREDIITFLSKKLTKKE